MLSMMTSKMTETAELAHEHARKQWKYIGYRGYCEFLASDHDFLLFRRFNRIAIRTLLALQDELAELEGQLEVLEGRLMQGGSSDVHNGSFRQETEQKRVDLVREMDKKLRAYYELVNQYSQLCSRPKAPQKDIRSISNWFFNHQNAILLEEAEYITQGNDLFSVVPKTISPLRKLLERSTHFRFFRFWRKGSVDDNTIHYSSDFRINQFITAIITILGLAMLIAPLWILAFVSDRVHTLSVITAFICLFLPLVTFTSAAKPFEVLAATAGYAAVLVVFLQIAS